MKVWHIIQGNKLFLSCMIVLLFSCDNASLNNSSKEKHKIETVNRQRCSFDVTDKLYLDRIDSSFNPQAYFNIKSYLTDNLLQLFVYDSKFDEEEKLDAEVKGLSAPDVFIPSSIEKINRFGKYQGKGVIMKGHYSGGIVNGTIKIFCFSDSAKGFLAVRQTIQSKDVNEFDVVENSFTLK